MNRSSCASGKRVGAGVLDGVLGRDDHERPGQLVCALLDCDAALLHGLQQPRLRLRRGAVDLVDEDDVREHRPRIELEAGLALVEDHRPDCIRREQIGRALNAENSAPTERATARARAVFPTPGWSSISTWPSASSATSSMRTASSLTLSARLTFVDM